MYKIKKLLKEYACYRSRQIQPFQREFVLLKAIDFHVNLRLKLRLIKPVIVSQASSVDKLGAGLGRLVVAEPRVVTLARAGNHGQGARITTHGVHADFGTAKDIFVVQSQCCQNTYLTIQTETFKTKEVQGVKHAIVCFCESFKLKINKIRHFESLIQAKMLGFINVSSIN